MDREEIESALAAGRRKEVCVFLDRPALVPGYVCSITLHPGNRVQVAYEVEGLDEGGAYFWATYPSLDAALGALAQFLDKDLDDWAPPHLERPSRPVAPDHEALAAAIGGKSLRFPPCAEFELQPGYWSQFRQDP